MKRSGGRYNKPTTSRDRNAQKQDQLNRITSGNYNRGYNRS